MDAREYAVTNGAPIMIYPPAVSWYDLKPAGLPRYIFPLENERLIAGLKEIFGKRNWPSNG